MSKFSKAMVEFCLGRFISRQQVFHFSLVSFPFLASEFSISRQRVFRFSLVSFPFLASEFPNFSLASFQSLASEFSIFRQRVSKFLASEFSSFNQASFPGLHLIPGINRLRSFNMVDVQISTNESQEDLVSFFYCQRELKLPRLNHRFTKFANTISNLTIEDLQLANVKRRLDQDLIKLEGLLAVTACHTSALNQIDHIRILSIGLELTCNGG